MNVNFNFLKHLPGLSEVKGYAPLKSVKDFDKVLLRKKLLEVINNKPVQQAAKKTLTKKASVFGGAKEPEDLFNKNLTDDQIVKQYSDYVRAKAYEPKSSWLTTSVYPGVAGTLFSRLAYGLLENKKLIKNKEVWPLALLTGVGAAGTGAAIKLIDDSKIDNARELVRYRDYDNALRQDLHMERKNIEKRPKGSEFLHNPKLKNVPGYVGISPDMIRQNLK